MLKKISVLVMVLVLSLQIGAESLQNSPNLDCIDSPTTNSLLRGMYNFHMRFYEGGGVLTRAWVGFTANFMIGATFNLDNVIGVGDIMGREPQILVKLRAIEDTPAFPAVAIGYEPMAYGFHVDATNLYNTEYSKKPLGLYVVVSKTLPMLAGMTISAGVGNHNVFRDIQLDRDLNVFGNMIFMLSTDFALLLDYTDITQTNYASLNLGFRYAFAPELRIELDFKGLTKVSGDYIRNLRIDYVNYF